MTSFSLADLNILPLSIHLVFYYDMEKIPFDPTWCSVCLLYSNGYLFRFWKFLSVILLKTGFLCL